MEMEIKLTNNEIDEMIGDTKYSFDQYDELEVVHVGSIEKEIEEAYYKNLGFNWALAREAFAISCEYFLNTIKDDFDINKELKEITYGQFDVANAIVASVLQSMDIDCFYDYDEIFEYGTIDDVAYIVANAIACIEVGYEVKPDGYQP